MSDNKNKRMTVGQGADAFFGNEPIAEIQKEQKAEREIASIPEKIQSSKTENEQATKPDKTKYAKAGYRVSPESANQMEEMRLILRRELGRKVYFEEMLEVMIDHAHKDLLAFQSDSFLARRLRNKTEK